LDLREEPLPVPARATTERMRVLVPRQDGALAAGRLPLVVFHPGAAAFDPQHPTLADRFDHLLRRWASHGFVVASIEAPSLVWDEGRVVPGTLANLAAMAENQRAAIARLRALGAQPDHPLFGHVDADRVIVAGHSRGGGAAILAAASDPAVIAGILLEPLDPLTTPGGEQVWNTALPKKPLLLLAAGNDADLPYPMVDFLYERRAGPVSFPTIVGATHFAACDGTCADEPGGYPQIARAQDWAVTNAYAVAFLKYTAGGELGYAPLLFGAEGLATALSPLGIYRRSDRAMEALVVDDFQDEEDGRNSLGLPTEDVELDWSADEPSLVSAADELPDAYARYRLLYDRRDLQAWSGAHRLTWSHSGAVFASELGGLDVRGRQIFALRARTTGGSLEGAQLALRFVDVEGNAIVVAATAGVGEDRLGPRFSDIIVPLASLGPAGVDESALARVELQLEGAGSLLIDDLRFE
jgi:dienelactone hydrolase